MKNQLLLIDNYDSFTFNLVQYLEQLGFLRGERLRVIRNDEQSVQQLLDSEPLAILLSPGPCTPNEAGIGLELVRAAWGKVPLFGVCLGLQTIVQAMGGEIVRATKVMHGKSSLIDHDGKGIFTKLDSPLRMGRYHSLIAKDASLPESILVSARVVDPPHEIMAIRGNVTPAVEAVQFHPESILSQVGHAILKNFLEIVLADTIIPIGTIETILPER